MNLKPFPKLARWILPKNVEAMTIYPVVYFRNELTDTQLKHELIHITQQQRDGLPKFLARYIWQWIIKGYRGIDYEIEAYEHEAD
jgi:hypothetical protein